MDVFSWSQNLLLGNMKAEQLYIFPGADPFLSPVAVYHHHLDSLRYLQFLKEILETLAFNDYYLFNGHTGTASLIELGLKNFSFTLATWAGNTRSSSPVSPA